MFKGNVRCEQRVFAHREREVSSARTQQHFKQFKSCEIKHKYRGPVVQALRITLILGGGKQQAVRLSALPLSL